jgi:hypothetical protein
MRLKLRTPGYLEKEKERKNGNTRMIREIPKHTLVHELVALSSQIHGTSALNFLGE